MSIEDVNKIDIFTVTSEDISHPRAIMVITDHLDWVTDVNEHLFKLQEKINNYIAAVESGDIYNHFPNARGRNIVIKIFFQHSLPVEAVGFLGKVRDVLASINIQLQYEESA